MIYVEIHKGRKEYGHGQVDCEQCEKTIESVNHGFGVDALSYFEVQFLKQVASDHNDTGHTTATHIFERDNEPYKNLYYGD